MNRRELFQRLAASSLLSVGASLEVTEHQIQPTDLIVLSCPGAISYETAERLKLYFEQLWPNVAPDQRPKVVVLGDGMTLQVHRNVVKVELPKV